MAAFVQSYGLQLLDRSGKDFDTPGTLRHFYHV